MKKLTINHNNGNNTVYQLIPDGNNLPIAYHEKTSPEVIRVLEMVRKSGARVKIRLGDTETGRDWLDTNDITGIIGVSRGTNARFPILLANVRSYGGAALLDHCIIKIVSEDRVLYQAANYQPLNIEIKPATESGFSHSCYINGKFFSNHRTERSAKRLKSKLS